MLLRCACEYEVSLLSVVRSINASFQKPSFQIDRPTCRQTLSLRLDFGYKTYRRSTRLAGIEKGTPLRLQVPNYSGEWRSCSWSSSPCDGSFQSTFPAAGSDRMTGAGVCVKTFVTVWRKGMLSGKLERGFPRTRESSGAGDG